MYPGQMSDEVLAERVARGDATALDLLYDRHSSIVLGLILRITGERAAAEAVLQETFWNAWKSAASYQPERESFTSWLFRIARQLAIDEYRRRDGRLQRVSVEDKDPDAIIERGSEHSMRIPERTQLNVISEQVREALKSLPREQSQVVELAYFYGMTRQEIAEVIDEPIGTIQTRARLGLLKLRETLKGMKYEF